MGQLGRKVVEHHQMRQALTPSKVAQVAVGIPGNSVRNIGASALATYIVAETGQVYCAGLNNYLQLGVEGVNQVTYFTPIEVEGEKVVEATGGLHHTVMLTESGKVFTLGRRQDGILGRVEVDVNTDGAEGEPG